MSKTTSIKITTDTIENNNANPITSDAVYDSLQNKANSSDLANYVSKTTLIEIIEYATNNFST